MFALGIVEVLSSIHSCVVASLCWIMARKKSRRHTWQTLESALMAMKKATDALQNVSFCPAGTESKDAEHLQFSLQVGCSPVAADVQDNEGGTRMLVVADPGRYEIGSRIGKGAYGSVFMAFDQVRQESVAIKKCSQLFKDCTDCKRNLRELAILSRLQHPNVVRIFDMFVDGDVNDFDSVNIVMELCSNGDLKTLLHKLCLTPAQSELMIYHHLSGLAYLHSAGIYHRDLKPQNCLLSKDGTLKICDFNLATSAVEDPSPLDISKPPPPQPLERQLTRHVVTRWYRAPEIILLQKQYDEAIDVWSAGCICAEILQMLEDTAFDMRKPLFRGHCCYPLSPGRIYSGKGDPKDQLAVIFDLLGLPEEDDFLDFEDRAEHYVRNDFKRFKVKDCEARRAAISDRVPRAGSKALDLLESMLRFGPSLRLTVKEALDHSFLSSVRSKSGESLAAERVKLDFEAGLAAGNDDQENTLRACFQKEILHFKSSQRT